METLYEELLSKVELGFDYHIDMRKHNLIVGGKQIIKKGRVLVDKPLCGIITMQDLETAYNRYKHSIPGREKKRAWFRALKYEELTDEDRNFGEQRSVAQFKLEYSVLAAILTGQLDVEFGTFFWRSKKFNEFILLINWI